MSETPIVHEVKIEPQTINVAGPTVQILLPLKWLQTWAIIIVTEIAVIGILNVIF
jgi:hypothetical protein